MDRFAARLRPDDGCGPGRCSISTTPTWWPARAQRSWSSRRGGRASTSPTAPSFDPSAEALTLTTKTADLGPVKANTYEVGSKTSLFRGGLLVTGALFHTEVDNAQVNAPENPTLTVLQGNETVQGLELGATGHIGDRFSVVAGYTYLDGKTSGTAGSPAVRYSYVLIPNLARNAVNLWGEYKITPLWEVGLGGNYLDRRIGNIVTPGTTGAFSPELCGLERHDLLQDQSAA